MKDILALLIVLVLALVLTSCDNITDQEDLTPGSRNYTWSIDTVLTDGEYQSHYTNGKIWGASLSDMWYLPRTAGELWKSDGKSWKRINFTNSFYPYNVCVLSANNFILISGNTYCIYNGSFGEVKFFSANDNITVHNMFALSATDIYAVGEIYNDGLSKAAVLHYNGSKWDIKITDYLGTFENVGKGANSDLLISLSGYYNNGIFSYDGKSFKEVSRNPYTMFSLGANLYMKSGRMLLKYKDGKIYSWKSLNMADNSMALGRSESDILYPGYYGIAHFNGSDETVLYPNNSIYISDGFVSGLNAYFLAYNYNNNQVQIISGIHKK